MKKWVHIVVQTVVMRWILCKMSKPIGTDEMANRIEILDGKRDEGEDDGTNNS